LKRISIYCLIVALLIFTISIRSASAAEEKWSIGPLFEVSFIMGGQAGEISHGEWDPPDWHPATGNLLETGWGGGIELGWRFDENWEAIFGAGYIFHHGNSISLSNTSGEQVMVVDFDDFHLVPIYTGMKVLLSNKPDEGLVPYLRADIGAVWMSKVNAGLLFYGTPSEVTWWDSSFRFMWDIGGGLEYRTGKWGGFIELLNRNSSSPKTGTLDEFGDPSLDTEATNWGALKIRVGANLYF